jgi:hypothetical protein
MDAACVTHPNQEVETEAQIDAATSSPYETQEVDSAAHIDAAYSSPHVTREVEQVPAHDATTSSRILTMANTDHSSARSGWNANHGHNTRFKSRLQANFTCV